MSEPQIDIRPDHWAIVRDILQRHVPQYAVWAFGSRAKWTAKEYSDLDLAIITDNPLPLATSAALAEDFSESDLPWKVDIVDWAETSETFRKIIERDRVVVQELLHREISNDRKILPLEDCLDALIDYRGKTPRKTDYGIPLITAKVIKSGRIETPDEFIAEEDYSGWMTRGLPQVGDVVLTTEAPLGEVAQIKFLPVALAQRVVTLRGKKNILDNSFLLYLLQSHDMQEKLIGRSSGTTVIGIKQSELRKVEVALPPFKEQLNIAYILGALDSKIELNRRMNETLEAMARSLFKSWFVDFDGLSAEDMQESELGLIPNGWQVASLDSIADYLNGLALQKFPPESEVEFLPVIKIAQLRAGNTNNADKASSRLKPEYIVEDGDVLFSWSGSLEVEIWTGGRGALNQHLFKVTSSKVPKWFYYFATRQYLEDFRAIAASKATTMGHIQRKHLTDAKIAVPSPEAMENFDCTIAPLFEQIIKTSLQSKALGQLRDTLLPKLISGEVRIKDAERLAETA